MSSLPISLNRFRKTYWEGMSRSQCLKAFDRFINDGTLPTKQEKEQKEKEQKDKEQKEKKEQEKEEDEEEEDEKEEEEKEIWKFG